MGNQRLDHLLSKEIRSVGSWQMVVGSDTGEISAAMTKGEILTTADVAGNGTTIYQLPSANLHLLFSQTPNQDQGAFRKGRAFRVFCGVALSAEAAFYGIIRRI